jgi:uncharacterized membrane protein
VDPKVNDKFLNRKQIRVKYRTDIRVSTSMMELASSRTRLTEVLKERMGRGRLKDEIERHEKQQ